ncbi:hypothetical protein [Actinoplanes sp. NPDC049599]|uniref:hypothetical protein n=1 Tax=Actinoplanes sp. NPDC049599 TaxID=3363903 RepID=UPI0037A68C6F
MAAELTSADYAFLIILKAEGREISNTEMNKLYEIRLVSPAYEKLNAAGYVSSETKRRPYRHVITEKGAQELADPLAIDEDHAEEGEKRTAREKQLWAAVVAQQNQIVRLLARSSTAAVPGPPANLDGRIRAAYTILADEPGDYVDLTELRPLLGDVTKADVDKALVRLHDAPDVRLEPEPFGHRIGAAERSAAVHIGGEDRHKLAIGRR